MLLRIVGGRGAGMLVRTLESQWCVDGGGGGGGG